MYCIYRTQVSLGSDLWVRLSLTGTPLADLTDVTIQTDNANRVFQGNECGNASEATGWSNLLLIQVAPPDGQLLTEF